MSDYSSGTWLTLFQEQAEQVLGRRSEEMGQLKQQVRRGGCLGEVRVPADCPGGLQDIGVCDSGEQLLADHMQLALAQVASVSFHWSSTTPQMRAHTHTHTHTHTHKHSECALLMYVYGVYIVD